MPRRFTPEDLADQIAIGQVELRPDGDQVVYTRRRIVDGCDRTELWSVPFAGGEARRLPAERSATTPRYAPDGGALAYLAEQADGSVQLVVADDGVHGRALTRFPAGVDDFAWGPDGTWLVVAATDARASGEARDGTDVSATAFALRRVDWRRDGSAELVGRPIHLHRVDRATGDATRLTAGDWSASSPRVRRDGTVLFLADTRPDGDVLPTPQVQLVVAPGEAVALTDLAGGVNAFELVDGEAVLQAREAHAESAPIRLYRLGSSDHGIEPLMAGIDRFVGTSALYSDLSDWTTAYRDAGDVTSVAEAGCAVPTRFGPDGAEVLVPLAEHPLASSISAAGGRIALTLSTGRRFVAPDVHVVADGSVRRLTTDGGGWLDRFDLPAVSERVVEGAGGPIPTYLVDPPGADPRAAAGAASEPLPTVLLIHGGPSLQWNVVPMLESLILASAGYRVAMPNIRGSIHTGGGPISADRGFWGEGDAADCHAVLDDLVAAGLADVDRLGVAGLSYGGFLTSWLVGTSHRFAAAVSENGVSNQVAAAGLSEIGVGSITEGGLGHPWAATGILWERSPLRHVHRIRTPLLLLQAANDRICPAADNEQLFVALRSLGREVEYVLYPEEGHTFQGSGRFDRRLDRHRRSLAWFRRWMPA